MGIHIAKDWLENAFNTIIENFSNGLSILNFNSKKANANDINITLAEKIDEIKQDYYLSTEANLFTAYTVSQGTLIKNETRENYLNEIEEFKVLQCKNIMNYNNSIPCGTNGGNNNTSNNKGTYNKGINNKYCTSIVQESRSSNGNGNYSSTSGCNHRYDEPKTCNPNEYEINLRCVKTVNT